MPWLRGYINIHAVLFDDYEMLDVYGPMELFAGCTVMPIRESKGKIRITFLSASWIEMGSEPANRVGRDGEATPEVLAINIKVRIRIGDAFEVTQVPQVPSKCKSHRLDPHTIH